eukprot:3065953-Heterocapsa_arctica.AAC.1
MSPARSASGDMMSTQSAMSVDRSDPQRSTSGRCSMYWKSRVNARSWHVPHFVTFAASRVIATR